MKAAKILIALMALIAIVSIIDRQAVKTTAATGPVGGLFITGVQYGKVTASTGNTQSVVFPYPFADTPYVQLTPSLTNATTVAVVDASYTNFNLSSSIATSETIYWFAIGPTTNNGTPVIKN